MRRKKVHRQRRIRCSDQVIKDAKVRVAGSLYVIAILVALFGEFMIGGKKGIGVALFAVPFYFAVNLARLSDV